VRTAARPTPSYTIADVLRRPLHEVRALQDRLLRDTIAICYDAHPFYGALMRRERIEPRHIQSCDELVRLPVSTKADFLNDPEAFRLRGDHLPAEYTTLWKVVYTTGTTSGRPAPIYVCSHDYHHYLYISERQQDLIGLRSDDVVANLFPLTPFPMGAYGRAFDEAAAVGAAIFCAHTGRDASALPIHRGLDESVAMVVQHRASVLWGVAGFVRRVLVRAAELGADLSAVRMAMITGEASSEAMRADMSRRMRELGCAGERIVNRYGSTEKGVSMVECSPGSGFHNLAPDQIFHEVVDDSTGQRVPDGTPGMLVFSHLMRRGTVFLRYRLGDQVTMTHATCPHCGRTSARIVSQPVRSGDIVKIKGTLVNLQALKDQLERLAWVDEYQIVIRPANPDDAFSSDELLLRIAGQDGKIDPVHAASLVNNVATLTQVRPRLEPAARNDIFDPSDGAKPRRILDLRPARN
jgi:phenylacetate-CoA ligase